MSLTPQERPPSSGQPFLTEDGNIQFKPLTVGLGFHQRKEDREEALFPFKKRYTSFRKPPQPNVALQQKVAFPLPFTPSASTQMMPLPQQQVQLEEEEKVAFYLQCGAFFVDLFLVFAMVGLTFIPLSFYDSFSLIPQLFLQLDVVILLSLLFLLYYFLYFVFVETSSEGSIGKSLLNLRIEGKGGQEMDLKKSFQRALLTLFSILLLGIPTLVGWIDRWSQTELRYMNHRG